ncbi:MAG: hypothetical protein MK102_13340 [Fuerstiella sp.]|nr:hypothetical protein [Fuerstiella sp.]
MSWREIEPTCTRQANYTKGTCGKSNPALDFPGSLYRFLALRIVAMSEFDPGEFDISAVTGGDNGIRFKS